MPFAQKLSNLNPVLNKPMQLKRITEGQSPQSLGDLFKFLRQKNDLNAILITFRMFLNQMNNYGKLLKFRSH